MTSQGVGDPFAPGEAIYGYQACGVTGSCYIGLGGDYTEQLMNICEGDTAVFRYVRSDSDYTAVELEACGSGVVDVMMSGKKAGCIEIENGLQKNNSISMPAGEYELELRFSNPDALCIQKITLR